MNHRQCVMCNEFVTSDHKLMKRHVAIIHGDSTFSILQCGICKRKYYDSDHFQDHVNETPSCSSDCLKITTVPLPEPVEKAFHSLVDQMMIPIQIQSAQFPSNAALSSVAADLAIGGIEGESLAQMQPPSQSSSQSCSSSVEKPFDDVTVPCNNESPKIISVRSLADQGHFVDQTTTMQDASLDSQSAEQIDEQHQEGEESVDQEKLPENHGSTSMFDAQNDKVDHGTEEVIKENNDQEQLQWKPSEADLRLHCRKIILKRQHKDRLTCSICKRSIAVVEKGLPRHHQALGHAQCHVSSPYLFACNSCDFKSNARSTIRGHVTRKHSSNKYTDTTADRIDELMQLVTRCFDHGPKSSILDHHKESAMSGQEIGTNQTISNGDCSSAAQPRRVSTMVGGLKLRISVSKGTDCRNSNGPKRRKRLFTQPRKSRYIVGRKKQGGFSVTLEKKNLDKILCAASDSRSSVSNDLNDQGIMQRLELPPHIRAQKEKCAKLAQKFVKNGKLECRLCQKLIEVSKHQRRASKFVNMQNGYQHAMAAHMHDMDLFECTICDYGTSNQTAIYYHASRIHNADQRKFIDHRAKYYPKILQVFLACYTAETMTSADGTEGHLNERTVGSELDKKSRKIPSNILKARRSCYDRVKAFIKNGKLYCQLCSQWIRVAYASCKGFGFVMNTAISHVTTHMNWCHLFESSTCHHVTRTKVAMHHHAGKCQKRGQGKFIDRSNQYYREILDQFLACFDVESSGEKLETETTESIATEQGTSVESGGCGKDDTMGNGCSSLEPKDSTLDQEIKSVCSKCGYKTAFQMLFRQHQKIMHAE